MNNHFRFSFFILAVFFPIIVHSGVFTDQEMALWKKQASAITIYRDAYGVPHIYGKTDADAVFGLLFAQCEDGFERVEMNYITALGRQSEVKGEAYLWQDLRSRLVNDENRAKKLYQSATPEIKKLLDAFAGGINYFLISHPEIKPKLLSRFEPWMHLVFSEGSIGGDITSISLPGLEQFYTGGQKTGYYINEDRGSRMSDGSNGFAISPSRSQSGNALFYINPHTTFYFRGEFHVVSQEGLNAYGAATWGQMFLYQGFNTACGWMHTSSQADVVDFYNERVEKSGDRYVYFQDGKSISVETKEIKIGVLYNGAIEQRAFTGYRTIHGPVVAEKDGAWISVAMMDLPLEAITQSFLRTKATGYESYRKTMDIRTNSSNNTVYADNRGNIAYWHGNFMPRRDPSINWKGAVDGSTSGTLWKGLHEQSEMIHLLNPPEGWIQNCNSNPFTATGKGGADSLAFPYYMAPDTENFRGIHARRLFSGSQKFSAATLLKTAFDPLMPAFEKIVPAIVSAYENNKKVFSSEFSGPVELLKSWDFKASADSKATTLAMVTGRKMQVLVAQKTKGQGLDNIAMADAMRRLSDMEIIRCLKDSMDELVSKFGSWQVSWGTLNRFQRPEGLDNAFSDLKESLPVGLGSGFYGALATFESRPFGTDKWYGVSGNSFVAVVEFGKKVTAKSILVGGQDCLPGSEHFTDQAEGYINAGFKDVLFYKNDVIRNAVVRYTPGRRQ
ncbi:MAG: penicillin acylase family protein [Cyclobacteriaceae bacterium]